MLQRSRCRSRNSSKFLGKLSLSGPSSVGVNHAPATGVPALTTSGMRSPGTSFSGPASSLACVSPESRSHHVCGSTKFVMG